MSFNIQSKEMTLEDISRFCLKVRVLENEIKKMKQEIKELKNKEVDKNINLNKKVNLTLHAVCECGHIIKDLEIRKCEETTVQDDWTKKYIDMTKPTQYFYPTHCPNCGREIESISVKKNLINKN